jgi:hypothetical protein
MHNIALCGVVAGGARGRARLSISPSIYLLLCVVVESSGPDSKVASMVDNNGSSLLLGRGE